MNDTNLTNTNLTNTNLTNANLVNNVNLTNLNSMINTNLTDANSTDTNLRLMLMSQKIFFNPIYQPFLQIAIILFSEIILIKFISFYYRDQLKSISDSTNFAAEKKRKHRQKWNSMLDSAIPIEVIKFIIYDYCEENNNIDNMKMPQIIRKSIYRHNSTINFNRSGILNCFNLKWHNIDDAERYQINLMLKKKYKIRFVIHTIGFLFTLSALIYKTVEDFYWYLDLSLQAQSLPLSMPVVLILRLIIRINNSSLDYHLFLYVMIGYVIPIYPLFERIKEVKNFCFRLFLFAAWTIYSSILLLRMIIFDIAVAFYFPVFVIYAGAVYVVRKISVNIFAAFINSCSSSSNNNNNNNNGDGVKYTLPKSIRDLIIISFDEETIALNINIVWVISLLAFVIGFQDARMWDESIVFNWNLRTASGFDSLKGWSDYAFFFNSII